MNEYSRIRNEHDRATILAQLVNADAIAAAAEIRAEDGSEIYCGFYEQSRAELWKLVGPAPEGEASE